MPDNAESANTEGRAYTGERVTVYYDARRCLQFAECIRGLPGVFDVEERPWIHPDNAEPERVAEVIRRCPSGALHYELADGSPEHILGRLRGRPGTNWDVLGRLQPERTRGELSGSRALDQWRVRDRSGGRNLDHRGGNCRWPMAPTLARELPAVLLDQADDLAELHALAAASTVSAAIGAAKASASSAASSAWLLACR